MPPRRHSRYSLTTAYEDSKGRLVLTHREPARFEVRDDTITHLVIEGETLEQISARYYQSFPRPAGLSWVIADFQPEPIHDPTLELTAGRVLFVPSERFLIERVFNEDRRS